MKINFHLVIFFLSEALQAQGICNEAIITVKPNSFLTLSGASNFTNSLNGRIENSGSIKIQGNWINNTSGGVFTNYTGTGEVEFNGQSTQKIGGASTTNFEILNINNSRGVTLLKSQSVNNRLILTLGAVDLNSNSIVVGNNLPSSITRVNGYLISEKNDNSGKVIWYIGHNLLDHVFPFGTVTGNYIPFTFKLSTGDIGNLSVATYPTSFNNTTYPYNPLVVTNINDQGGHDNSANTVDRFWEIDKAGDNGTATLTFTARSTEVGHISPLQAQQWNPSSNKWSPPLPFQTNTPVSATVAGVIISYQSSWVLSGKANPLPVELKSFVAIDNDSVINLTWITASETNNEYFTIQKSTDGNFFCDLDTIEGAGNCNTTKKYDAEDKNPTEGISYYRLKQIDFNGENNFSNVVNIHRGKKFEFSYYPNPVKENKIMINALGEKGTEFTMVIYDLSGVQKFSQIILFKNSECKNQSIEFPGSLNKGVYVINILTGNKMYSQPLIID